MSQRPLLLRGGLTNSVYIVTRYTISDDGMITARQKYDVTGAFELIRREMDAEDAATVDERVDE
jgi:hypothetical protein